MPRTRSRPTPALAGDLIRLSVAAFQAGVKWRRAWDDVLAGKLKAVPIDGHWYCRQADIEAWIAARATGAPPAAVAGGAR